MPDKSLPGSTWESIAKLPDWGGLWEVTFGGAVTITTLTTAAEAPTVVTNPPTDVAPTSAVLNGSATPSGDTTTAWFRYSTTDPGSCDDSFGTRVPASGGSDVGAGGAPR